LDDIPLLVEYFLGRDWRLGAGVAELFQRCLWPGNIRQLVNALERAKILSDNKMIEIENLPPEIASPFSPANITPKPASNPIGEAIPIESISRMHVTEVLKRNKGNKSKAARELGIARRSLYRILEKLAGDS
jgi:transcriptional regulator with PAS, ATPase and Fis domain